MLLLVLCGYLDYLVSVRPRKLSRCRSWLICWAGLFDCSTGWFFENVRFGAETFAIIFFPKKTPAPVIGNFGKFTENFLRCPSFGQVSILVSYFRNLVKSPCTFVMDRNCWTCSGLNFELNFELNFGLNCWYSANCGSY